MEKYLVGGALACALIAAAWDVRGGRIPNRLTYGAALLALAVRAWLGGWPWMRGGLVGGLIAGGIFFLLFLVHGMGAGDVKLMAAIGCWVGPGQAWVIVLATALAGGLFAVAYMVLRKRGIQTLRNLKALIRHHLVFGFEPHPEINLQNPEAPRLPYAVAIAAGTFYSFGAMLFGR